MRTRFIFDFGMTAIFALPLAIDFGESNEDDAPEGASEITLHIGPLYFVLTWWSE